MADKFSKKTFEYFDLANKHKNNKAWFEKNQSLYLEHVRQPFSILVQEIGRNFQKDLPRIHIEPKSICRPLRPQRKVEEDGVVKNFSHITLWEKKTSLFEWNPGIHIQFGANKDDNLIGIGLYMVSSRQLSLLRNRLVEDFDEIDALLRDNKLKKSWGTIQGEKYKRFPKGYNAEDSNTAYLWHKQFYLGQNFSRTEVLSKNFNKEIIRDLKIAIPFFKWVRQSVGTYHKGHQD